MHNRSLHLITTLITNIMLLLLANKALTINFLLCLSQKQQLTILNQMPL